MKAVKIAATSSAVPVVQYMSKLCVIPSSKK